MNDNDEPEQDALFDLEGPDEDACVWLHTHDGTSVNLGPAEKVAEKLSQWLASYDDGERL
jgi:hypothetical protein